MSRKLTRKQIRKAKHARRKLLSHSYAFFQKSFQVSEIRPKQIIDQTKKIDILESAELNINPLSATLVLNGLRKNEQNFALIWSKLMLT